VKAIKRGDSETRVVVVSAHDDSESIFRALAAGADAYLSKTADQQEISDTVAAVARGTTQLAPSIQAGLVREIHSRSREEHPGLTPREREILALTAQGLSAPDIGARLHLSTSTIKTHMQHLYEKLGVTDRAAAVAEAMRRGLMA
jgi:two-component system, NarL family, nitrate/nitrite response regulator NarL